ncbi:DinB superfamily protein [Aquisphaera giovannonii]|uniref:DinB superfamily protein n=1 Tax=Aquisphaera giovannonii TaxID=406548 RepID=A0A5B9WAQ6_9BACT|nr:DinB family protein [Aquisphaera giovannonii]QEH37547.1 DinB superfamily protein [Aquisphaera giovannonii]
MGPKDVLRRSINGSDMVLTTYLSDLSDEDLLVRPLPGLNHIAWQMGHIIGGTARFMDMIEPGSAPPLPEGFAQAHGKEAAGSDDPSKFLAKGEYLRLWTAYKEAVLALLDRIPESRLDEEDPNKYPPFAPNVGALFGMAAAHPLMHAGQFVAVRRKLGKPVLI